MRLPTVTLRHALGRVDREADRLLGRVEIDDDAGLDAARAGEAKPSTSTAWVRRRSVSPSRGLSRAIRQQTLVEPTSSTLTVVERRAPSGLTRDTPVGRAVR